MSSVAEELERLAALRDRGVITEAEFDRLKARLIESGRVSARRPMRPCR